MFSCGILIFSNFKHFKWAERPLRIGLWPWKVGVRIDTTGYTNFKSAIFSSTLFIILSISKKVILTWFSSAIVVSSFNLQPNTIIKLRAKLNQAGNVRDIQQRSRCRVTARGHDRFVSFNYLKSTRLEHACLYCYFTLITLKIDKIFTSICLGYIDLRGTPDRVWWQYPWWSVFQYTSATDDLQFGPENWPVPYSIWISWRPTLSKCINEELLCIKT